MLAMPRRSVTRFFIPLIDVLTLLFCVFLIMPLARNPTDNGEPLGSKTPEEQVEYMRQEIKRLLAENLQIKQERDLLKKQKQQDFKAKLVTRILGFDFNKRELFEDLSDKGRRVLKSEADVIQMVQNEMQTNGLGTGELSYQLLLPRDTSGNKQMTAAQDEKIRRWFDDAGARLEIKRSPYD